MIMYLTILSLANKMIEKKISIEICQYVQEVQKDMNIIEFEIRFQILELGNISRR